MWTLLIDLIKPMTELVYKTSYKYKIQSVVIPLASLEIVNDWCINKTLDVVRSKKNSGIGSLKPNIFSPAAVNGCRIYVDIMTAEKLF